MCVFCSQIFFFLFTTFFLVCKPHFFFCKPHFFCLQTFFFLFTNFVFLVCKLFYKLFFLFTNFIFCVITFFLVYKCFCFVYQRVCLFVFSSSYKVYSFSLACNSLGHVSQCPRRRYKIKMCISYQTTSPLPEGTTSVDSNHGLPKKKVTRDLQKVGLPGLAVKGLGTACPWHCGAKGHLVWAQWMGLVAVRGWGGFPLNWGRCSECSFIAVLFASRKHCWANTGWMKKYFGRGSTLDLGFGRRYWVLRVLLGSKKRV